MAQHEEPTPTQLFYGKSAAKAKGEAGARTSPTVTKLQYGDSPSIDAVAASLSPFVDGSDSSPLEKAHAFEKSPALHPKGISLRAVGLRAISDAVTGDEKKRLTSATSAGLDKPQHTSAPFPHAYGSSTPSSNSRSLDEDSSFPKNSTASSDRPTPTMPKKKGKKATSAYVRGLESKGPNEAIIDADYSGWMKKKSSNLMTSWRTRLFILKGTRLSYYYTELDKEEKGLIDISFHRVLPANNDRILGLHATMTGACSSPTSPQNPQIRTSAAEDVQNAGPQKGDENGMFIFKLVPPRSGLSRAVNFTKPTVHYFAVDSVQQGRLWMAALMKATIERDQANQVITTYKDKTISLAKAQQMRQRPPFLDDLEDQPVDGLVKPSQGLNISLHADSGVGASEVGEEGDASYAMAGADDGLYKGRNGMGMISTISPSIITT